MCCVRQLRPQFSINGAMYINLTVEAQALACKLWAFYNDIYYYPSPYRVIHLKVEKLNDKFNQVC